MHWNSAAEFFAMGGYALYVWGSFGACLVLMVTEPLLARRRAREIRQSLERERLAQQIEQDSSATP